MKRIFTSLTLTCALLLTAIGASAQGVYIYKDGKRQVFQAEEVDSLVFFANDNSTDPTIETFKFEMPNAGFGTDMETLLTAEQAKGFDVSKEGTTKLNLKKTADGVEYNWVYNFDDAKTYRYAKCQLPASKVDAFKAFLRGTGYALQPNASQNAEVQVYLNTAEKTVVFLNKEADATEFYFGAYDESFLSWTRISTLKDEATATWMPFYGKHATVELMKLFEKRMNHKMVEEKSNAESGIYFYETGNPKWPSVKYWFDAKTKTKLEETSIFSNKETIPVRTDVTAYLEAMGYRYTGSVDAEGYIIYYNDSLQSACYVLMSETEGQKSFEPQMHYAYVNLEGFVPPATVNFPMPIINFGTKTMDEILEEYRAMPYYKSDENTEMGLLIHTTSPDFPQILLMEDGGKYFAAIVITFDQLTIRSQHITNLLTENGYEYKADVSAFPTFINYEKDVMAQFDLVDIFQLGWYSVSFQPNEFK